MKRTLWVLGIMLGLGLGAGRATAQAVRMDVRFYAPPVAARIVVGHPAYEWYYPAGGLWLTNPRLVRLHHRHMAWLAREQARLDAMRYRQGYWNAARAFERERLRRERELDRAYRDWLRDRDRAERHGHRH